LLVHRRRAEQALASVIAQAYVEGVSTRRVEELVEAVGIAGISPSQVSRLAAELDAKVAELRERPLDAGPYRYLWIDALTHKVREGGRVVNLSAVIATAVNVEGRRAIVGFDIVTTESTVAWTALLRSLVARGLLGWSWSSPTPTAASRPPLRPCWARRRGSVAERSSWPTCRPGPRRRTGR